MNSTWTSGSVPESKGHSCKHFTPCYDSDRERSGTSLHSSQVWNLPVCIQQGLNKKKSHHCKWPCFWRSWWFLGDPSLRFRLQPKPNTQKIFLGQLSDGQVDTIIFGAKVDVLEQGWWPLGVTEMCSMPKTQHNPMWILCVSCLLQRQSSGLN